MKLFLDDVRQPKDCTQYMHQRIGALNPIYLEDWMVVRNYDEFVNAITEHIDIITHISFDHDLSDEHYDPMMYEGQTKYNELYNQFIEKTGYECAKWMKEFYKEKNKKYPVMFVHSMNPTGTQNIINVFKNG
jgi:hypothetical protein